MEVIHTIKDNDEGFDIGTSEQLIKFGISMEEGCCERFGYFTTNDEIDEFIGAELLAITKTDTALDTKKIESEEADNLDEGDIMFINFETSKGTLQFVAYNSHNGYYGHAAYIKSKQLTLEEVL